MRFRSLQQRRDDLLFLLMRKAAGGTGEFDFQTGFSFLFPGLIPATDTLSAYMQATANLGIGEVLGKEFCGLHATGFVAFIAFDNRCVHSTPYYETRDGTSPYRAKVNNGERVSVSYA